MTIILISISRCPILFSLGILDEGDETVWGSVASLFGPTCCAIEMMSTSTDRFVLDIAIEKGIKLCAYATFIWRELLRRWLQDPHQKCREQAPQAVVKEASPRPIGYMSTILVRLKTTFFNFSISLPDNNRSLWYSYKRGKKNNKKNDRTHLLVLQLGGKALVDCLIA